jgi:glutamate-ammonia-ligase adenylyltransferase
MDLEPALAFSRYAGRLLAARPELRAWLEERLEAPFDWTDADRSIAAADQPESLAAVLRQWRAKLMLHTLVRDLTRRAGLAEVCAAMTGLAERAIASACAVHARALSAQFGEPRGQDQAVQALHVVAMGKLGGRELNVSSDIDLVFAYPEEGETDGERRISNREYFERLGRRLIAALGEVDAGGFVFRVDMRLRPYGDAGPLALPFSGLEQYLITQGRTWERYAWLKARCVTGERADELGAIVTPFVYRKYLDYDAYAGLRDVHRQIRDQAVRREATDDVKIGAGGIREVEFIAQALQLVRGGRDPGLRVLGTRAALEVIAERGLLPATTVDELARAYVSLREIEHRLQYRDDAQTQRMPAGDAERLALAQACDLPDADALLQSLAQTRAIVSRHIETVLGATAPRESSPMQAVWEQPAQEAAVASLRAAGFREAEAIAARLGRIQASPRYLGLPAASRERFDTLVPRLLDAAREAAADGLDATDALHRLVDLLETVSRRSAYLALLIEHPPLLPRLVRLIGASPWAADYLNRHPILLDELLDTRILLKEADWDRWRAELAQLVEAAGADAERQMDALRHFQHAHAFRLLAQDIAGLLTVERLADHLSALADVVLEATLAACWRQVAGADARPARFAVIGYGKLGGKELGYASDLDLVFLYQLDRDDPDPDRLPEDYARLAKRINTWLTSTTPAGSLYETDLRLRPDGASGLLVTSLDAFRRYQRENAWTWEHQALTRARFVAGDAALGEAFEAERDAILRLPRDPAKLAADVIAMRRKMDAGHPNRSGLFDLKHDAGGMVDIEFAVQYLVLAHSQRHAVLTANLGNIALLGRAGSLGLVDPALALEVADAYRSFRRAQHALRLKGAQHARVEPDPYAARRDAVAALWRALFGAPWQDAEASRRGALGSAA